MPSLSDDSLVRFADRQDLLAHVLRRGAARRRRSVAARALGLMAVGTLLVGAPMWLLMDGPGQLVRTLPVADETPSRTAEDPEESKVPSSESEARMGESGPSRPMEPSSESDSATDSGGAGGSSQDPPAVPVGPRPEGEDDCSVTEVGTAVGSAGDGPTCGFVAVSEGGYEAVGDWQVSIRRGDAYVIYSSRDGSPGCGRTGTIQPGDHVTVNVKAGTAGAGSSYGQNCSD